jgi:hypothetical protein
MLTDIDQPTNQTSLKGLNEQATKIGKAIWPHKPKPQ